MRIHTEISSNHTEIVNRSDKTKKLVAKWKLIEGKLTCTWRSE